MSYVIAGASGNTGRVAAEDLLARGKGVRVLVRSAEKGAAWKARGAEVAVADLGDAAAVARALEGAEGAFLLVPPSPGEADFPAYQARTVASLARAVTEARVPHVVLLSSVGAQLPSGTGPIAGLHRGEKILGDLAATRLTAVRAAYFMENFASSLGGLKDGVLPSFLPADLAFEMIATRDIGTLVASLLLEGPSSGERNAARIVELGGAKRSARDAAKALSAITGRPIEVAEAPLAALVPTLTGFGLSPSVAEGLREMYEGIVAGRVAFEGGHRRVEGTTTLDEVLRGLLAGAG